MLADRTHGYYLHVNEHDCDSMTTRQIRADHHGTVNCNSVTSDGDITTTGKMEAVGDITTTGSVTTNAITATGTISCGGLTSGGDITTTGTITTTGNIDSGTIGVDHITAGNLTAVKGQVSGVIMDYETINNLGQQVSVLHLDGDNTKPARFKTFLPGSNAVPSGTIECGTLTCTNDIGCANISNAQTIKTDFIEPYTPSGSINTNDNDLHLGSGTLQCDSLTCTNAISTTHVVITDFIEPRPNNHIGGIHTNNNNVNLGTGTLSAENVEGLATVNLNTTNSTSIKFFTGQVEITTSGITLDSNSDILKNGVSVLPSLTPAASSWTAPSAHNTSDNDEIRWGASDVVDGSYWDPDDTTWPFVEYKAVTYANTSAKQVFLRGSCRHIDGSAFAENEILIQIGQNLRPQKDSIYVQGADGGSSDHHFNAATVKVGSGGAIRLHENLIGTAHPAGGHTDGTTTDPPYNHDHGLLDGVVKTVHFNMSWWTD